MKKKRLLLKISLEMRSLPTSPTEPVSAVNYDQSFALRKLSRGSRSLNTDLFS